MHRPDRPDRLLVVASVAVALLVAGCSSSPNATGTTTPASAGIRTPATVAATPVSAFRCPESATTAGVDRPGPAPGEKLRVVTTVAPLTSIVANVAGERATVTGVIPEGEDSHTYEPKPSVATQLSDADVVFVNGLTLEDPTKDLAEANLDPGSQVVALGSPILSPEQHLYDFSFPLEGGKPNPHLWTNPPMARCYALTAASVLAKADPAGADSYRQNAERYAAKLDRLDELMRQATDTVPDANRQLLTYHDAYAYFAEHYGWKVIGAIQVSSFEDPTPKEVADLVDQIRAERVPAIFGSEVFPSPVLQRLADETGVRYVDTLRDDDLPGAPGEPGHSFLELLRFDFVTMVEALGGDASGLRAFDTSDVAPDRAGYPQ